MLKDKKIIIVIVILILVYFTCLLPFKFFNKNELTVYLGSLTKVTVNNGEISVNDENSKINLQKVNIIFNKMVMDAYIRSEEGTFDNGEYVYSATNEANEAYVLTDGLIAFTGKDDLKVIGVNGETLMNDEDKNIIKEFMNKMDYSGDVETSLKYEYDINSNGKKEKIYNLKVNIGDDSYYTICFINDGEKSLLLNNEQDGAYGKYTSFYKLIDFNSDGIYEIVLYNYNGNNSLSSYKIYEYNNGLTELN